MVDTQLLALNAVYVYWLYSHWPSTSEYSVTYTVLPFVGRLVTFLLVTLPRLPDWKYWLPPGLLPASIQYAVESVPAVQVKFTLLPLRVEFGTGEVITPIRSEEHTSELQS